MKKGEIQLADRRPVPNPPTSPDPSALFDPAGLPERSADMTRANYGPNLLRNVAASSSRTTGVQVAVQLDKAPESYHPKSLMPKCSSRSRTRPTSPAGSFSIKGEWPVVVDMPDVNAPPTPPPPIGQGRARELVKLT